MLHEDMAIVASVGCAAVILSARRMLVSGTHSTGRDG
jgi:hypothetical protein